MSLTVRLLLLSLLMIAAVCVYVFVIVDTDLPCLIDGIALMSRAACQP